MSDAEILSRVPLHMASRTVDTPSTTLGQDSDTKVCSSNGLYDDLGDSASMVGATGAGAVGAMTPDRIMREILALQEHKRQLERKLAEERAIAEAAGITSGMLLEDRFQASVEQHVRSFGQLMALPTSREDL